MAAKSVIRDFPQLLRIFCHHFIAQKRSYRFFIEFFTNTVIRFVNDPAMKKLIRSICSKYHENDVIHFLLDVAETLNLAVEPAVINDIMDNFFKQKCIIIVLPPKKKSTVASFCGFVKRQVNQAMDVTVASVSELYAIEKRMHDKDDKLQNNERARHSRRDVTAADFESVPPTLASSSHLSIPFVEIVTPAAQLPAPQNPAPGPVVTSEEAETVWNEGFTDCWTDPKSADKDDELQNKERARHSRRDVTSLYSEPLSIPFMFAVHSRPPIPIQNNLQHNKRARHSRRVTAADFEKYAVPSTSRSRLPTPLQNNVEVSTAAQLPAPQNPAPGPVVKSEEDEMVLNEGFTLISNISTAEKTYLQYSNKIVDYLSGASPFDFFPPIPDLAVPTKRSPEELISVQDELNAETKYMAEIENFNDKSRRRHELILLAMPTPGEMAEINGTRAKYANIKFSKKPPLKDVEKTLMLILARSLLAIAKVEKLEQFIADPHIKDDAIYLKCLRRGIPSLQRFTLNEFVEQIDSEFEEELQEAAKKLVKFSIF